MLDEDERLEIWKDMLLPRILQSVVAAWPDPSDFDEALHDLQMQTRGVLPSDEEKQLLTEAYERTTK